MKFKYRIILVKNELLNLIDDTEITVKRYIYRAKIVILGWLR